MGLPWSGGCSRAGRSWVRRRLAAVVLLAAVPTGLTAQQNQPITISGRVTSTAGRPLAQAQVSVDQLGVSATTRGDGSYTLQVPGARVPAGPVTVSARLIGFRAQSAQVQLGGGADITQNFNLADNPLQLGEIVVTGAGTVSEVERLGTVRSSIDSTAIVRSQEQNLATALAAKAPNVNVVQSSGEPGASAFVQIRGLTTIQASDGQPLFVVDGVPVDNSTHFDNPQQLAQNGGANPPNRLIDINPDDIENVEILKGASSGAIYGARAGQGVVLITTKKGRPGATRASLRTNWQLQQATQLPPLQTKYGLGTGGASPACLPSSDPALQNCFVGFGSAGSWGPVIAPGTPTYDHASEMLQNGYLTDNSLSVSGGSERTTFFLSGAYNYNRGYIVGPNNNFRRIAVRFNGNQRITDKLNVGANISYSNDHGGFVQSRNTTAGIMLGAWRSPPEFNNLPYLDPVFGLQRSYRFPNPGPGSEQTGRLYDNPFFVANEEPATSQVGRTFGNVNAEWTALGWLKFNWTLGADYNNDERTQAWPWQNSVSGAPTGVNGVGGINAGYLRNTILDHNLTATANYTLTRIFKGTVTLGQNLNSTSFQSRQSLGTGLIAPQPFNLANTSTQLQPYDFKSTVHIESYFGQATADLWDQLFLTAAVRNDGASTFGASSRRNWFPKGSAAWVFRRDQPSSEGTNWLTYGKIRAGYGQSGTQPPPYLLANVYLAQPILEGGWGPQAGTQIAGVGGLLTTFNLPSQNLGPERVKEFEAGIDLGLFNDKADLSVTHYRQNSSGVILAVPVASSTGYSSQWANAASLQNRGWEVTLNVRPINKRNFGWDVGFQWSRNRGITTDLAGVTFQPFPNGGGNNGLGNIEAVAIVGQPIGVYYGDDFVRCGRGLLVGDVNIDATPGQCAGAPAGALYIGADGYPVYDATGQYVLGDPNPDWTGSVRTNFRIAKLSISGLLDVRHGGINYNGTLGALNHFGTSLESQVRRDGPPVVFGSDYQQGPVAGPGAGTAVPLNEGWFTGAGGVFSGPSSQFLQDGGFVKIREISLGYTFDRPWVNRLLGFSSMEVRLAARNPVSWNSYVGVDPETAVIGAVSPVKGFDYFNNPQSRSWAISLTVNR
jgi:TonB-linked SusC/RagA family outer membrane protein